MLNNKDEFKFKPYLKKEILEKYNNKLHYIEDCINKKLNNYPNYEGIYFCDVGANGIQINGCNKQIKGYVFGEPITINYDFSNVRECINNFIEMWKHFDNEKYVKYYLDFLSDGEKYGWD